MTFSDSIIVSFSSRKLHKEIDLCEIFQGSTEFVKFTSCENSLGVSVWQTLWHGGCFLRGPQVSATGLTVQRFPVFKCLVVLKSLSEWDVYIISCYFIKLSKREKDDFMIRIIIKCSKNISFMSPFLFHTNVVKHEKEGQ